MTRWKVYALGTGLLGLFALPFALVDAQEPTETTAAEEAAALAAAEAEYAWTLPEQLDDPAFEQYVDITLLPTAFAAKDAALLTDVALQLARGEEILLRPHRAGSAQDTLDLAVRIAASQANAAVLERIEKSAQKLGYEEVAQRATAAKMTAGESRAEEPALAVSVASSTPDQFAVYGMLLDRIDSAQILHDTTMLDQVAEDMKLAEGLTKQQQEYLTKQIAAARDSLKEAPESTNSVVATLNQLEGESRQDDAADILNAVFQGVTRVVHGPGYHRYGPPGYHRYGPPGYHRYGPPGYHRYGHPGYHRYGHPGYHRYGHPGYGGRHGRHGRW